MYKSSFLTLHLKNLIRLAQYLVLVDELLAPGGAYEIIAAVLATATIAANDRYHVAAALDANHIARHPHDLTDEVLLLPRRIRMSQFHWPARVARHYRASLQLQRVSEHHRLPSLENIAVNPVHYHSVSLLQLRGKPPRGHREDSESVGADCPSQEQRQRQRHKEFDGGFQCGRRFYLMLSTNLKSRFHRMPEKPGWSGLWLHQMKIGLPTTWSSGTKPQ